MSTQDIERARESLDNLYRYPKGLPSGRSGRSEEYDEGLLALSRVEAEIARLERRIESAERWQRAYAAGRRGLVEQADQDYARAEAAEAEVARFDAILTQTQDECTTLGEEVARLRDGLRDLADLERPADLMRQIARGLLADQDTVTRIDMDDLEVSPRSLLADQDGAA